ELAPNTKQAWVYYAIALKSNGEQAAGEDQLKRFEQMGKPQFNPELKCHIDVVESLAWADLAWNRNDDAFKGFGKAVEWCPQCGGWRRGLAQIYLAAGDKERAEEFTGKALAVIPGDPDTQKLAASLGIAATAKPADA